MIKTAYEYLFVVLSNKIAMVRKELDGFSVVPVSDSGEFFLPLKIRLNIGRTGLR